MWVSIIQPQTFKDKYLQCVCAFKGFLGGCLPARGQFVYLLRHLELCSEEIVQILIRVNGHNGTKGQQMRPMFKIK